MRPPGMCGVISSHRKADLADLVAMGVTPSRETFLCPQAAFGPSLRSGNLVLQWDGRIYNSSSLRKGLSLPRETPEPLLVVHGWENEGRTFLQRINGPFALAVLDLAKGTWALARGWQGLRPLYWFESQEGIAFARDLPTLFRCPWVSREPHWEKVPEYLVFDHVAGGETLYRGVRELLPGQVLSGRLGDHGATLTRLPFALPVQVENLDGQDLGRQMQWTFKGATARLLAHTTTDSPLLFLSGGIDSALLAEALSDNHRARGITAVTVTCPGYRHDEAQFARAVRETLDLPGAEIPLTPSVFASAWQESVQALQAPLTSTNQVPWWLLCQWAKKNERPFVFAGEGADGWFSGGLYDQELEALAELWEDDPTEAGRRVIFCQTHRLNDPALVQRITTIPLDVGPRWSIWEEAREKASTQAPDDAAILYHIGTAGNRLLTRADLVAACHGIELNLPFLDESWLHRVLSVPFRIRNYGGVRKHPLKVLCANRWGETFAHRKKIGFSFPIRTWIRDAPVPLLERWRKMILEPRTLGRGIYRGDALQQEIMPRLQGLMKPADWLLWGIVNLELWLRDMEE